MGRGIRLGMSWGWRMRVMKGFISRMLIMDVWGTDLDWEMRASVEKKGGKDVGQDKHAFF